MSRTLLLGALFLGLSFGGLALYFHREQGRQAESFITALASLDPNRFVALPAQREARLLSKESHYSWRALLWEITSASPPLLAVSPRLWVAEVVRTDDGFSLLSSEVLPFTPEAAGLLELPTDPGPAPSLNAPTPPPSPSLR